MEGIVPSGRKITLNFAVAGYEIDPDILKKYFDPDDYIIKLTPMHKTSTAIKNGIETKGDYTSYHPYAKDEKNLKDAGYDVLVFIASEYEDLGRITCGNAILSGTMPLCPFEEVEP
jgi:23S rRNA (adenine2503-C2)-methyltransferase